MGQGMQVEYRAHLVKDYGEAIVNEFDSLFRRPKSVKDWNAVRETFDAL